MAVISMREMLEAGVHFGHQTRRWNPKMRRFIFGERNGIYIIDLEQTLSRVETAYGFVRELVANGGTVLFVGTKKQAQDPVQSYAEKVGMPYVNERWLGGMLTNFETISKRVGKMLEYERMKASGEFDAMIKKEALLLDRELAKLQRNLGGLRDMKQLPDAVFVIDTKKEHIAVTEANKLGIPVVAVVDTNVDPDVIQYPIPGNDDAIRANMLLAQVIAAAVEEGRYIASRRPKAAGEPEAAPKAERTPEEEAAFAQAQAEARSAAARAQAEREARLTASKSKAPAADDAGEARTEQAPVVEEADGSAPDGSAPEVADEPAADASEVADVEAGDQPATEVPEAAAAEPAAVAEVAEAAPAAATSEVTNTDTTTDTEPATEAEPAAATSDVTEAEPAAATEVAGAEAGADAAAAQDEPAADAADESDEPV